MACGQQAQCFQLVLAERFDQRGRRRSRPSRCSGERARRFRRLGGQPGQQVIHKIGARRRARNAVDRSATVPDGSDRAATLSQRRARFNRPRAGEQDAGLHQPLT